MNNRIKVTSRRLPNIISTSPNLKRIDGAIVAEALEAERVESPVPGIMIPTEFAMLPEPDEFKSFERLANQKQPGIATEFYEFLRYNKKWWLLPILLLIGGLGILVALASTGVAPFIYTMF
jgi:Family of unknown function (DUF5989)